MSTEQQLKIHSNALGFRGVEYNDDGRKKRYGARICPEYSTKKTKIFLGWFHTAEEAAKTYDAAARKYYGSHAALNFPQKGERQALPTRLDENMCAYGHDLEKYGYNPPGTTRLQCRECNMYATRRCRKKLKAMT